MNFALASPILAKAWAIAAGLWFSASSGVLHFEQVPYCSENNLPCVTIKQVVDLPNGYIGMTSKYGNAYTIETLDPDPLVLAHEAGHVWLGLRYHAPPKMSLMSAQVGNRCLGDSDAWIFEFFYHRPLKLLCLR